MKINQKVLSIPPYISTTWDNIASLHMQDSFLIVTLLDGEPISIPDLTIENISEIFDLHAQYLEKSDESSLSHDAKERNLASLNASIAIGTPFKLGFGLGEMGGEFSTLASALQHNIDQKNAPDLPKDVLKKIASVARIIASDANIEVPKAEPHCNCFHCQISRAIHYNVDNVPDIFPTVHNDEQEVPLEELNFCEWEINQTGDKLFTVTNRSDNQEQYNVYLGHPIGCTCGKQGCVHIVAVLKS